jgi:hypothetical protein
MLSEFRSLNLKLCSKQYNKNFLLHLIVAPQLSNITTQPKQSWSAAPMSSLCIMKSVYNRSFCFDEQNVFFEHCKKVETISNLNDCIIFLNLICGLYYKNIMIVNDAAKVISEGRHNLEHHLRSSITLLESFIMLLELSIMLLDNMYSTGITHDNHHMMIIICL